MSESTKILDTPLMPFNYTGTPNNTIYTTVELLSLFAPEFLFLYMLIVLFKHNFGWSYTVIVVTIVVTGMFIVLFLFKCPLRSLIT